ncbi:RecQ family zinc-binding domain-containing protein [Methanoculleus frigidifontis]|uniref:RecQ family zinc-binding domain-containing protein n=1 Tax=Methanoculleus frigidifontis TaxID=2584085 RepID=UPI002657F976|nr:RecQ family zinc-binding domain-containing protein [Methanoculleus sp. FWC-SCC1]
MLLKYLAEHRDASGIVCCLSQKSTEELAEKLQAKGSRAGRDGEAADCILFSSRGDCRTIRYLIERENTDAGQKEIAYRKIGRMLDYCETTGCRRKFLLRYFGEVYPGERCGG